MTCISHHLHHALQIMRTQPDYRQWGPLIDALPAESRDECRAWLRVQPRRMQTVASHAKPSAPRSGR